MSLLTLSRSTFQPRLSLPARLRQWRALWASRRALASLNAEQLADVGLSARTAATEAARPFWDAADCDWDAPASWRR